MKKEELILNIENLMIKIDNIKDSVLKAKSIIILSQYLNKIKNYELNEYEKKKILLYVRFIKKQRDNFTTIDKFFNTIDCWFYIDFSTEEKIKEMQKKEFISNKEFSEFVNNMKLKSSKC